MVLVTSSFIFITTTALLSCVVCTVEPAAALICLKPYNHQYISVAEEENDRQKATDRKKGKKVKSNHRQSHVLI